MRSQRRVCLPNVYYLCPRLLCCVWLVPSLRPGAVKNHSVQPFFTASVTSSPALLAPRVGRKRILPNRLDVTCHRHPQRAKQTIKILYKVDCKSFFESTLSLCQFVLFFFIATAGAAAGFRGRGEVGSSTRSLSVCMRIRVCACVLGELRQPPFPRPHPSPTAALLLGRNVWSASYAGRLCQHSSPNRKGERRRGTEEAERKEVFSLSFFFFSLFSTRGESDAMRWT